MKKSHTNIKDNSTSFLSAISCFPSDEKIKIDLHRRAEKLAQMTYEKLTNEDEFYILFSLSTNDHYGIDYHYIKEVINHASITKIPCSLNYIEGVINRRGALISIINLNKLFYRQEATDQANSDVIIVTHNNMTVGILTHKIHGNQSYHSLSLASAIPSEQLLKQEFIVGLDKSKTAIINIESVMNDIRQKIGNHAKE